MGSRSIRNSLCLLLGLTFITSCSSVSKKAESLARQDSFSWLEEVESKESLAWASAQNKKTEKRLMKDSRYGSYQRRILSILESEDKIPFVRVSRGWLYNFWQDKKNPKGIWRRTTLNDYRKENVRWSVLLDVDKLSREEKVSWVFKGTSCLPDESRCLVRLSKGGKDAVEIREFDTSQQRFVSNGFFLPEAKTRVSWISKDSILVATDFGPGTLTTSGYARIVKRWDRNQLIQEAVTQLEGKVDDVSVEAEVFHDETSTNVFLYRNLTFYTSEKYYFPANEPPILIPVPKDAEVSGYRNGWIYLSLRSDWNILDKNFKTGSLVVARLNDLVAYDFKSLKPVYVPSERTSLQGIHFTKSRIFLSVDENVKSVVYEVKPQGEAFSLVRLNISLSESQQIFGNSVFSDLVLVVTEGILEPPTLSELTASNSLKKLKSQPEKFQHSHEVVQRFAKSADGTEVPYFLVRKKGEVGPRPLLLYGYGGFMNSITPGYSAAVGAMWIEKGYSYVVANIRGGGEFGPKWHEAALATNRNKSFEDFIAVAEDLIRTRETISAKLGIFGGSNGGLLTTAVMILKPDLFGAVVSAVPLTDMLRYHKLLAGASWIAEYGNPDTKEVGDFWAKYSPYHNIQAGVTYPEAFIYTSTKDDRVHPAHARKFVAKLESLKKPVLYYENMEGGHAAAADPKEKAKMEALKYIYFEQKLGGK